MFRRALLSKFGAFAIATAALPAIPTPSRASPLWRGGCVCGLTSQYGHALLALVPEFERARMRSCAARLLGTQALQGCPSGHCIAHWLLPAFAPFAAEVAGIDPLRLRNGTGAGGLAYAAVFSAMAVSAPEGCGAGPVAPASAWIAVHGAMDRELLALLPRG
jgi:hypothetical protein